ncbi:MAG: hypothetical protein WC846_01505 [Candidatus Gracilibacteria bacterium]|jgi:hypothetical protein
MPDSAPRGLQQCRELLPGCPEELLGKIAQTTSLEELREITASFGAEITEARAHDWHESGGTRLVERWGEDWKFGVAVGFQSYPKDELNPIMIFFFDTRTKSGWRNVCADIA